MQISICIPVFRGGRTLRRCLDSALAQGAVLQDAEILVADNCSDDDSVAVAEKALRGFPNARVLRHTHNVGRIGNWNQCLVLSNGEWIKFLMASDVLLPGAIATLLAGTSVAPDTVFVGSRHQWWDGVAWPLPPTAPPQAARAYSPKEALECLQRGGDPFWALNGALLKGETVRTEGLRFDDGTPYVADKMFCLGLAMRGTSVFVEANTYGFNASAQGRFHFAGKEGLVAEAREFYLEVDRLARSHGIVRSRAARRTLSVAVSTVEEDARAGTLAGARSALASFAVARVLFEGWLLLRWLGLRR